MEEQVAEVEQTPEEEAAAKHAEELETQKQELRDAQREVAERAKEPPPEPWISIIHYVGVGPMVLKTPRGEIKAFSGDVIGKFWYEIFGPDGEKVPNPEHDPEDEDSHEFLRAEETIILTYAAAKGLFGEDGPDIPERAEDIAQRIGEKRRREALEEGSEEEPGPSYTMKEIPNPIGSTPVEKTQVGNPPPNSNPSSGPGPQTTLPNVTPGVAVTTTATPSVPSGTVVQSVAKESAKTTVPPQGSGAGNVSGGTGETKTAGQ